MKRAWEWVVCYLTHRKHHVKRCLHPMVTETVCKKCGKIYPSG